ncbi:MAG TPA: calcium-binding protein [Anaerolineae bacterium]
MTHEKKPFKLGDSVRFKDGLKDEDSGIDIGGWQGRVIKINAKHKTLLVALDSITLKSIPREHLEACEEEGLGWSEYYIGFDEVEPAEPRDTKQDVKKTIADLSNSLGWVYLGEEGREINAILAGADNEYEQMGAWEDHLEDVLTFPFEAEISEWQR